MTERTITQVGDNPGNDLALLKDTCRYAVRSKGVTPARVQRNIRVGHLKARFLVSLLESWGVVDAASRREGVRAVLVTVDDLPGLFGRMDAASGGGDRA